MLIKHILFINFLVTDRLSTMDYVHQSIDCMRETKISQNGSLRDTSASQFHGNINKYVLCKLKLLNSC